MGKYVSSTKFSMEFDGDVVTATLSRISFADALALSDETALNGMNEKLRSYITDFKGLTDAAGVVISLDTVLSDFYFSPIVLELTRAILATGTVPKKDTGPLDKR